MSSASGYQRIKFDNFKFGDYGSYGGSKAAPEGSFDALNMLVYADGSIGPRPGWANRTPNDMPNGKLVALLITQTPTRNLVFIVADDVRAANLALLPGSGSVSMGTLDTTPTTAVYPKAGTAEYYIAVPGDKCYKLDPPSGTITSLAGSPGGTELEVYGLRLVVVDSGAKYRILYSAANDFESWPAENFLNVGDLWDITALREQKNHLTIMKSRGTYVMTGVPGTASAVVRKIDRSYGPLMPSQADIDQQDTITFIPAFRQNPATFDGAQTQQVSYLTSLDPDRDSDASLPLVRGFTTTLGDQAPSTLVLTQGDGHDIMVVNQNGVWTKHHVEKSISGMVRGGYTGDVYVTDGGADASPSKIYSNHFNKNRPGFSTDQEMQPGDDSLTPPQAYVAIPQWWAPDDTEVTVRQVIVDYTKWNTGADATNHFDIIPTSYGRFNADAVTQDPISFDQAGSGAGGSVGDNTTGRFVAGFPYCYGAGFSIKLDNIRGVAIRSITVEVEIKPNQPTK